MKVKVNNLGAIETASIDLGKRINLLCGHNGTGKTYLSYLIYGILRNHLHIKENEEIANRLINDRIVEMTIDSETLASYRRDMLKEVANDIDTLFGIGTDVKEKLFDGFSVEFEEPEEVHFNNIVASSFTIFSKIQGIRISISKKTGDNLITLQILDESIANSSILGFRFLLNSFVYYTLAIFPISDVTVFPVERNSIYTFSKELSIRKQEALDNFQLLIDKEKKISKFDILFNSKRYPLPVKDGLAIAEDLAEVKKNKSDFFEFAEEIESELLHGRVQISNDGEIQFRPDRALRTVLPIQMTASVVKTLSSLVVYLKHIAKANDLIIIDEPEINLHPSNQIILARILARLANRGFRLLISTHSDYIVREFNNLAILGVSNNTGINKIRKTAGLKDDEYIDYQDISVSSFCYKNRRAKHVSQTMVPVDQAGFAIDLLDQVIEEQNSMAEKLYYALKYGNEGE